jgi:hypothetical protein
VHSISQTLTKRLAFHSSRFSFRFPQCVVLREVNSFTPVPVDCLHHADPRKHCRTARRRDQQQRFRRSLPLRRFVLGLWKLRDVGPGILQRDGLAADAIEIRMRATRRLDQLKQAQKETVGLNTGSQGRRVDKKPTLASQFLKVSTKILLIRRAISALCLMRSSKRLWLMRAMPLIA